MAETILIWIFSGILLLSGCAFCLSIRHHSRHSVLSTGIFRKLRMLPVGLWLLLVLYQTRWQLFGFFNDDFLRVQRGFDARGAILKDRFIRGSILDAHKRILASDRWENGVLVRHYPTGAASVHLIGYHHALFGSTGLEKVLNNQLMGRTIHAPSDALRLLKNIFIHSELHGNPVQLTVYRELQEKSAELLKSKTGAIVLLNPQSGTVLAMVSTPGFNPEHLDRKQFQSLRKSGGSPFLNRVTHGLYPPGSTFKTIVSEIALRNGLDPVLTCTPDGFNCGPDEPPVRDYQYYTALQRSNVFRGHGKIDLRKALTVSCNVYFASLGVQIGGKQLLSEAHRIGLDEKISPAGKGLSGISGRLPSSESLSIARTARIAIGQDDVLVTPLHLALLAGAIGNGGDMYHPRFLKNAPVKLWKHIMDSHTATELARMMIQVVESGTGHRARVKGIVVGGKTGTAETASGKSHALFIGFAPWPEPYLAFAIVVEHAGTGGLIAAPIAAQLIKKADELGLLEGNADHEK